MLKFFNQKQLLEAITTAINNEKLKADDQITEATITVKADEAGIAVTVASVVAKENTDHPLHFLKALFEELKARTEKVKAGEKPEEKKSEPKPGGEPTDRLFHKCSPLPPLPKFGCGPLLSPEIKSYWEQVVSMNNDRPFCKPFPKSLLEGNWVQKEDEDLYREILRKKINYYGSTEIAYESAAMEFTQKKEELRIAFPARAQNQIDELKRIVFEQKEQIAKQSQRLSRLVDQVNDLKTNKEDKA